MRWFHVPPAAVPSIDLIGLANQVENMVEDIPLDIKVAVMGCVVNGPGEAKEADIGIAGGKGERSSDQKRRDRTARCRRAELLNPCCREELSATGMMRSEGKNGKNLFVEVFPTLDAGIRNCRISWSRLQRSTKVASDREPKIFMRVYLFSEKLIQKKQHLSAGKGD